MTLTPPPQPFTLSPVPADTAMPSQKSQTSQKSQSSQKSRSSQESQRTPSQRNKTVESSRDELADTGSAHNHRRKRFEADEDNDEDDADANNRLASPPRKMVLSLADIQLRFLLTKHSDTTNNQQTSVPEALSIRKDIFLSTISNTSCENPGSIKKAGLFVPV